jgi:hypothetical protein
MAIDSCLVDTNILLRSSSRLDPQNELIELALAKLASERTSLCFTHQNIAELWNAMTRPVARNGFGLTADEAGREVRTIESSMRLLADSEAVYRECGGGLSSSTLYLGSGCTMLDWWRRCGCMKLNTCLRSMSKIFTGIVRSWRYIRAMFRLCS